MKATTQRRKARQPVVGLANIAMAAETPAPSTRKLSAMAGRYYRLSKQAARLKRQMDTLGGKLKGMVPTGRTLAGKWAIDKAHYPKAKISYTRDAYDALKVNPA